MKSRNQREGKFIPGWCYNPDYRRDVYQATGKLVPKTRAGKHYKLTKLKVFVTPDGQVLKGTTFYRTYREGAFE